MQVHGEAPVLQWMKRGGRLKLEQETKGNATDAWALRHALRHVDALNNLFECAAATALRLKAIRTRVSVRGDTLRVRDRTDTQLPRA